MQRSADTERGQLLLVAGLGIAVAFVALALIVNSAVFAQTLATRPTPDGADALGYEHAVSDGVGGALAAANYESYDGDLAGALNASVDDWSRLSGTQQAAYGTVARVSLRNTTTGSQVRQSSFRRLTNASGSGTWTAATGVTGTRRFRLNVSDLTGTVTVRANGASDWSADLSESGGDVVLDTTTGTCRAPAGDYVTVDLTRGAVGANACANATFPGAVSGPYDIEVANGGAATATYGFVVDVPRSGMPTDQYSGDTGTSPYVVPALYDATLALNYSAPRVSVDAPLTVAPNAPAAGDPYAVSTAPRPLVFVDVATGNLSSIDPATGEVTDYGVGDASAIGPKEYDLDSDGRNEVPYVNSSNALKLVDAAGERQVLATGAVKSKTLLAVGTWRGATSVFYANTSDGTLWRASTGGASQVVVNSDSVKSVDGVLGVADFNGDGDGDLVYVGSASSSYAVHYVDGDVTHSTGSSVSTNNGLGGGAPRLFDTGQRQRVPMTDGSANVGLMDYTGSVDALTSSGPAAKSPVAGVDWTGGDALEAVYVDAGTNELYYVTLDGSKERVRTESGAVVAAESGTGVA
ncbi:MAG: hypothetical protein ABEJ80_03755 [Halarchaeum sp.]